MWSTAQGVFKQHSANRFAIIDSSTAHECEVYHGALSALTVYCVFFSEPSLVSPYSIAQYTVALRLDLIEACRNPKPRQRTPKTFSWNPTDVSSVRVVDVDEKDTWTLTPVWEVPAFLSKHCHLRPDRAPSAVEAPSENRVQTAPGFTLRDECVRNFSSKKSQTLRHK